MIASGVVLPLVGEEEQDCMMKSGVGCLLAFGGGEEAAREQRVERFSQSPSSRLSRGRAREGC
jgi:hypothetical protein